MGIPIKNFTAVDNLLFKRFGKKKLLIMEKSFLATICKYFLFFVNLLVFILGLAVLGCAITALANSPWFLQILQTASEECGDNCGDIDEEVTKFTTAAGLFIVLAVFITILAFLGCCGAWKENRCMLITFFSILLVIFICMIAASCVAAKGDLTEDLEERMSNAMKQYDNKTNTTGGIALNELWDEAQAELLCCGVANVTDWQVKDPNFPNFPNFDTGLQVPKGCCTYNRTNPTEAMGDADQLTCQKTAKPDPTDKTYYFEGCYTHYYDNAEKLKGPLTAVAVVIMVFMFLNIIFSFAFCIILDHEDDDITWNNVQLRRSMRYERFRN